MKILTMDMNSVTLFFSDMEVSFENNMEELEENLRTIFLHLKNVYNLDMQGYYIVDIYKDVNYGVVVEIEKEELDYFEYFDNQVDMRISIHTDSIILYKFTDIFSIPNILLPNLDIYVHHNIVYGRVNQALSPAQSSFLMEYHHSIVYGDSTKNIVQKNNLINKTNLL